MLTVSENIPYDQLDVFQHHSFQHRLTDDLHFLENVLFDDGFVGVLEDCLFLYGSFSLLLVPDGIGVGLEVDRTACVFSLI